MNYLFSQGSLRILESLSFTQTLYAFDFDGTLAPIVRNLDDARMSSETERLFLKLSRNVPTAILSGRSLDDLKKRVPESPSILVGNHGLEGLIGGSSEASAREECSLWRNRLESDLLPKANDPGLILEDKGLSLALHYRKSRKKKVTRGHIVDHIKELVPSPRVLGGKLVLNLIPKNGPHKGLALKRLQSERSTAFAFYIGDDATDEDVFSLFDPKILTVRIGQRRCSEAKYFLKGQSEITRLLSSLLAFHGIQAEA